MIRIGLDIDEVIAGFTNAFYEHLNLGLPSSIEDRDPLIDEYFHLIKDDLDFWHNIEPLIKPEEILIPPICYCTARPIPSEITAQWLKYHRFPEAEVRTVGYRGNKAEYLRDVDYFLDDSAHNFLELNEAGINCFLLTKPYNLHIHTNKRARNLQIFYEIIEDEEDYRSTSVR